MNSMFVRDYEESDAKRVAEICNTATKAHIWDKLNPQQQAIALLTTESAKAIMATKCVLVLEVNNSVLAMCAMTPPTGYIDFLYVDPAHMRNGFGRTILLAMEKKAKALGITQLSLYASDYASEVSFYEQCGFTNHGAENFEIAGVTFRGDKMTKQV